MPSILHEALIELFRQRIDLAPELIQSVLGVDLPEHSDLQTIDANLTQIVPTEYHADLVVLLLDGKPVHGIVVEVQLGRDPDKRFSWPLYATALRARIRCPVSVLVVCPDDRVATWAAEPIAIGPGDSVFRPLVLGPGAVPWTRDREVATQKPELAVLSALAHGNEDGGLDVVVAALNGLAGLDEHRAALYADLVYASLHEAVAKELNAMVSTGKYELQSDFAKKYFAQGHEQGEAEGRAAMLLRLIERQGLTLSDEDRTRILGCSDTDTLDRWFDRAIGALSVDDIFAEH